MATTFSLASNYAEIARRPLAAEACTLLVIDIQEKLLPPIFNREAMVKNTQLLIRLAQATQIPALVTTQYAKGLGATIPEIATLLPQAEVFDKLEFNCFGVQRFCGAVKSLPGQRNTLLVCGMETHICVLQTVMAALNAGYLVHVAADAVGARAEFNWKIGLERMHDAGAVISSTETILYEIMRASGGPVFKQMLPYLKG